MNTYQPRQVDTHAPRRWVREALALMARRPAAYTVSTAIVVAVFFLLMQVDSLGLRFVLALFAPPLTTVGFLRLAQAADHSDEFTLDRLLPTNAEALKVLAVTITGYCVIFAPLALLSTGAEAVAQAGVAEWALPWQSGSTEGRSAGGASFGLLLSTLLLGASLAAFSGLLIGMGAWFTLPLASLNRIGLVEASLLSWQASRLNAPTLRFSSFTVLMAVLCAVVVSFGLLALVLAPFLGAVLYVSYRDVFLGRAQNAPAAVRSGALAPVRVTTR